MATLNDWALTTIADVKESLGITGNSQDNLIIRKINQATDMIEAWCGLDNDHHFAQTTYTDETYYGTGTNSLVLKARFNVVSVSISRRNTTENVDSWTTVNTEDYFVDSDAGILNALSAFYWGPSSYKVTYTAGFDPIPSDLAEATVVLASFLVENATGTGQAIKAKTQGPKKIEYHAPDQSSSDSLIEQLGLDDTLSRYRDPNV